MIIVDTSVWADHFRSTDADLLLIAARNGILQHPLVTGKLAMGNLRDWRTTVEMLRSLPQAAVLQDTNIYPFLQEHRLMGTGLGFIDAHILATSVETPGAMLWTRDRRLLDQARSLGVAHEVA